MPEYIPDGFAEYELIETKTIYTIIYKNDEDIRIIYSYLMSGGAVSVNNEKVSYSTITENSNEYHLFTAETDGYDNSVIWDMDGYRFTVTAPVNLTELTKIAFSIK